MNTTTQSQLEKQTAGTIFFSINAMTAFKHASKFKGKNGRLATLPDIVDAKIAGKGRDHVWQYYLTTLTAEYFGSSRGGNKILIVGHNVGPFADERRVTKGSFTYGFLDLSKNEFRKLESGIYGPVNILDIKNVVCTQEDFPWYHSAKRAKRLNLLRARLGPRTDEFLDKHDKLSKEELEARHEQFSGDCVIQNEHCFTYVKNFQNGRLLTDISKVRYQPNCSAHKDLLASGYHGNLVTITQPMCMHHDHNGNRCVGIISEVGHQKFSDAARFIAIRGDGKLGSVSEGIEGILDDVENNIELLMVPRNPKTSRAQPYTLTEVGDNWFTQYRDENDVMETYPECKVISMKAVGEQTTFKTEILGYYGLFKYELDTVKKMLPEGANAFVMGEPHNVWENGNPKYQEAPIQFYKVEIDSAKRLLTPDESRKDWERILTIAGEI